MRIALISTPFFGVPPAGYSGLERIVWDNACALTELGQKVVVFAPGNKNPPNGFLYRTGEPVNKVEVNWREKEMEMYEFYKDKLCDFDVVHGNNWFAPEYLFKSKHQEARVLHTHHGGLNWRSRPPNVKKLNLVAISDWMRSVYESQGWSSRRCYNGIEIGRYPFKKEKGDRLLYVGRFSSFKQPHVAVEIAKRLNMGLDLCGGTFIHPQDKPYLENLKKMCGQQIKMYLDAPHETKIELMQNAKCLLFPSKMGEPWGLVAAEAMSCGTPVVALRDGAIPEVVEDGVTSYVCDTTEQMVEAVKRVNAIKPEDCRKRVEEKFSREQMARDYLKIYEDIVRGDEW